MVLAVLSGSCRSRRRLVRRRSLSSRSTLEGDFVEAGKTALPAGKSGPSTREAQLEAQVADLTQASAEAAGELRV